MAGATGMPPNVLVVVLDCMRASDFPGYGTGLPPTPCIDELRQESTAFRRAVTPAPWTIPAHASLMTGLYPWKHGTHALGDLRMGTHLERVPQRLKSGGYATFSLSANPLLEPAFEFTRGFDRAAWASWWESFLRVPRTTPAPSTENTPRPNEAGVSRGGWTDRMLHDRLDDAFRFAAALDAANRVAQGLRAPERGLSLAVAPWIEPTLAEWIGKTPRSTPVFAFVNLVEVHEPYFRNPTVGRGLGAWLRYARCRQDYLAFLNGEWAGSTEGLELLHRLYRAQVEVIDRRLARLVQVLKEAGRWENTLMVVTSDHGQAFGEHGMLFHMIRPDETLLRVPLLVRFPDDPNGRTVDHWVSLTDIAPTVLHAAGIAPTVPVDGEPLKGLLFGPRDGPVLAGCEGVVWDHNRARLSPERMALHDHVVGVAYRDDWKVVVDLTASTVRAYDVVQDPGEAVDRFDGSIALHRELETAARGAATALRAAPRAAMTSDVEERLKSWGYT